MSFLYTQPPPGAMPAVSVERLSADGVKIDQQKYCFKKMIDRVPAPRHPRVLLRPPPIPRAHPSRRARHKHRVACALRQHRDRGVNRGLGEEENRAGRSLGLGVPGEAGGWVGNGVGEAPGVAALGLGGVLLGC